MSRQSHSLLTLSVLAAGIIAANRFATLAGEQAGAAGDAFGVALSDAASGEMFPLECIGTAVVETGGAFNLGELLQSDASGRAVRAQGTGLRTATIAGGAAGNHMVPGILSTDRLVAVLRLDRDATAANIDLKDITSEFVNGAWATPPLFDGLIRNVGGTNTTGDSLLVIWESQRPVKARAMQASDGAGEFVEVFLYPN